MTGIVTLARPGMIEVIADGAFYKPEDGSLVELKEKIIVLPEVPMVITGRGGGRITTGIAQAMELVLPFQILLGRTSFDDLALYMQTELAGLLKTYAPYIPESENAQIIVAGFSKLHCVPSVGLMSSLAVDEGGQHFEAWKFYQAPKLWIGGPNIFPDLEAKGITTSRVEAEGLEPFAVDIMEAMRSRKDINPILPDLPPIHAIGGHIQHVAITPSGATSRILHRWDDPIGKPIDPFRPAA